MRVLHLTNTFLPVTQNWIYNQLRFMSRCTSSVLCQYRENSELFPFDPVYPMVERLTPGARLAMLVWRALAHYPASATRNALGRFKPDLIHGHFAHESWRHLAALQSTALPLVTTFYGIDVNKLPQKAVWRRRYAELFSRGDAFIVEGDFMAEQLAGCGCPAQKIHTIPIGIDIEAIRSQPRARDSSLVRVLFIGLNREKKGAPYAAKAVVKALQNCPNLVLDCIGDGRFRSKVQAIFKQTGRAERVTFHGTVPVQRYLALLGSADIVLAPSITAADGDTEGGAPVTVLEAQAAGIPVVGTLHCDIPMVVEHGRTGLLAPERDTDALAAHLELLAGDRELRAAFGVRGAARAAQRHDIKKQVERICDLYDVLTSGSSRSALS
ncbi:MAG: glycosyltransferase [Chitinispirillaceae bacterium]|nr:glycosyltransferase [Chitinispirillaceae bacterium]